MTLDGRYTLDARLGRGGMAEVWAATRVADGVPVAVKWMHPELLAKGALKERFAREQSVLRSLQHPNVVRVLDDGEDDGRPFLVMERLGETLQQRITARGPSTPTEVVQLGAQVCAGVGAVHALGVVHRDIKPSNLLFGADGEVRVADLGIAVRSTDPRITADMAVLGSLRYMPPEQRFDAHHVDARADVYAVAATLRFALVGKAQRDLWREQADVITGIPEAWVPLFQDALAWDPARRPPTVAAFAERLVEAASRHSG